MAQHNYDITALQQGIVDTLAAVIGEDIVRDEQTFIEAQVAQILERLEQRRAAYHQLRLENQRKHTLGMRNWSRQHSAACHGKPSSTY